MLAAIRELLAKEGIRLSAPILLRDCRICRGYLLDRVGIRDGTAIMLAVPYVPEPYERRNLSAYAAVRDYHLYFHELFDRILTILRERFPTHRFAGFADHSPIDEIDAALRAGLGVRGDHGLLLTEDYSSYVFLGELITDAILPTVTVTPGECLQCGACRRACPVSLDKSRCLSALTQKKGSLTEDEERLLDSHPLVWGCDTCQEACPYTHKAARRGTLYEVPPFFRTDVLPYLTAEQVEQMDKETFERRAYAWRGPAVILRNLKKKDSDHI